MNYTNVYVSGNATNVNRIFELAINRREIN